MKLQRVLPLLCTLAVLAAPVAADTHPNLQRGLDVAKSLQIGDVDHVNLFNGSLTLTIPIGARYPVNGGLTYGLTLVNNSNVWDFLEREAYSGGPVYNAAIPNPRNNAGLGWMLSLGHVELSVDSGLWTYTGPDGAEHAFQESLHTGETTAKGQRFTRDGSYLRMNDLAGGVHQIEFPSGEIHEFGADGELQKIYDRFANLVTLTQLNGGLTWQITDPHGRVQQVNFASDLQLGRRVTSVVLTGFNGTPSTYTFAYAAMTVTQPCPDNDTQTSPISVNMLTSVTLPDGSSYAMPSYHLDQSAGCRTPGALTSLTLPTLGKISWTYQQYQFPAPQPPKKVWRTLSNGVATRTLSDAGGTVIGTWQYATALTGSAPPFHELVNTVTTPLAHKTENFFSVSLEESGGWTLYEYGLPLTRNTPDATGTRFLSRREYGTGDVLLRSTYLRYERDVGVGAVDAAEAARFNQRVASTRAVYEDDSGTYADTDWSDFDGLGHYRTTQTGGNFAAGNVRSSYARFNPGRGTYPGTFTMLFPGDKWLLETFDQQDVTEAGQTARRTQVVDANNGWISRVRVHRQSTGVESSQDVVTERVRDSAGNLISERSYGGDTQLLGTGSLATLALPQPPQYRLDHTTQYGTRATSQYMDAAGNPLSFKSLDQTIDLGTGLPSSSRDSSLIQTSYEYDTLGRLRFAKPESGHDGWTEYAYTPATSPSALAQVNAYQRPNGGGTPLAESLVKLDAFGRAWQEQQKMPGGTWSTRETLYNAMGWKASVSELGNTGKKTQYLGYDPFGRPDTIRPPDGSNHDVNIVYTGVRSVARSVKVADTYSGGAVSEHPAWTTEFYDRQGRLYQVKDEADAGSANTTTTYTYDVDQHLIRVQQTNNAGSITQNRYFNYDRRGFLLSEQHPEKGATANGFVYYTNYDARGHARRRYECSGASCTDRMADVSVAFDRAERVTTITDITVPATPKTLKAFVYGTSNAAGVRNNGKTLTATRYNYVASPFNTTVEVAETYTYGGRQGRVSRKNVQTVMGGANIHSFVQSYTYNELGDVSRINYPECTYLTDCPTTVPRTQDFTYTNGMLTAVPGFATSITYHSNGLFNQVTHTNSVVDTQTNDPNGMARPAALTAARSGATIWTSGTYAYDGAGNVERMDNGYFLYDHVSRLVDGRIDDSPTGAGTLRYQTYTYDPFGNLTNINGDPWAAGRGTPTSATNNRLTTATYDVAGNMLSWQGNTYEYDALGMMIRMVAGAEDWRYLYTADDERFWSYRNGGGGSIHFQRDLDGKVLREYDDHLSWTTIRDYIYRDGKLLASNYPGEGDRHFSLDHLGTPQAITNSAGVAKIHLYLPYGEELSSPSLDVERMKFTGHERDFANTSSVADDLDYMHARFYNPQLVRFLSTDPGRAGSLRRPQSWNKYVYGLNNPIRYVDPDGEKAIVSVKGNKVHIQIPVRFVGKAATTERIQAFTTAVEKKWSGTFGKYEVTTEVTKGGIMDNRVKLDPTPGDNDKHVSNVMGSSWAHIYTEKDAETQAEVDAHEAGHLMHLDDKYDDDTNQPFDGWDDNIMAELFGNVWALNIDDILQRMNLMNSLPTNPAPK